MSSFTYVVLSSLSCNFLKSNVGCMSCRCLVFTCISMSVPMVVFLSACVAVASCFCVSSPAGGVEGGAFGSTSAAELLDDGANVAAGETPEGPSQCPLLRTRPHLESLRL